MHTRGENHPQDRGHERTGVLWALGILSILLGLTACLRQDRPASAGEPLAAFALDRSEGKAPLRVSFRDHSVPGSQPVLQRIWDFGDGHSSESVHPTHQYEKPGLYTVSLTLRNEIGESTQTWDSAIEVWPRDVVVTVVTQDENGRRLEGVEAVSENLQIERQEQKAPGELTLWLRPRKAGGLLRLQRAGYRDSLLFLNELSAAAEYRLTLLPFPAEQRMIMARAAGN